MKFAIPNKDQAGFFLLGAAMAVDFLNSCGVISRFVLLSLGLSMTGLGLRLLHMSEDGRA